jgi:hypothetical protein
MKEGAVMFRSMSRVVVVAIVVLACAVASIPVYAAPHEGGKAAVKAESGWFEAAVAWVSQVIFGEQPARSKVSSSKKVTPLNGSCVDPFGRCP